MLFSIWIICEFWLSYPIIFQIPSTLEYVVQMWGRCSIKPGKLFLEGMCQSKVMGTRLYSTLELALPSIKIDSSPNFSDHISWKIHNIACCGKHNLPWQLEAQEDFLYPFIAANKCDVHWEKSFAFGGVENPRTDKVNVSKVFPVIM